MKHLFHDLSVLPDSLRRGVVAIGNFDGVHRGHRQLIAKARQMAQSQPILAITFNPHPLTLVKPEIAPKLLGTIEQNAELLLNAGCDGVLAYPVTRDFLEMTAEQFYSHILRERLQVQGIVEGENFVFGKDRTGNVEFLRENSQRDGIHFDTLPTVMHEGNPVSSTIIRHLLSEGDVKHAAELLERPYRLSGIVGEGDRRGHKLGFPTANLVTPKTLIPGSGVYAAQATVTPTTTAGGPITAKAAVQIGRNLTFGGDELRIEAHLLDFSGDLYGWQIAIDFLTKLRDIRKFSGEKELIAQVTVDVAAARETPLI